jgi:hypothetical protein
MAINIDASVQPIGISLDVDRNNHAEFSYHPAVKRVYEGDAVQWSSPFPFTIMFKEGTPSHQMDVYGVRDDDGQYRSDVLQIRPHARGHFPYAVAIQIDDRIFLDASCPEIIAN